MSPKLTKKSLFTRLLDNGENVIAALKRPAVKNKNKRALYAAFESAWNKKVDAQIDLGDARKACVNVDVLKSENMTNSVQTRINTHQQIVDAENTCKIIKLEYLELFGEEMNTEELDLKYDESLEAELSDK